MTAEEPRAMTQEERAFHELGMDGVIEDAPDSDDKGDEMSAEDDDWGEDDPSEQEVL